MIAKLGSSSELPAVRPEVQLPPGSIVMRQRARSTRSGSFTLGRLVPGADCCYAPRGPPVAPADSPLRVVTFNIKYARQIERTIEVLGSDSLRGADGSRAPSASTTRITGQHPPRERQLLRSGGPLPVADRAELETAAAPWGLEPGTASDGDGGDRAGTGNAAAGLRRPSGNARPDQRRRAAG